MRGLVGQGRGWARVRGIDGVRGPSGSEGLAKEGGSGILKPSAGTSGLLTSGTSASRSVIPALPSVRSHELVSRRRMLATLMWLLVGEEPEAHTRASGMLGRGGDWDFAWKPKHEPQIQ